MASDYFYSSTRLQSYTQVNSRLCVHVITECSVYLSSDSYSFDDSICVYKRRVDYSGGLIYQNQWFRSKCEVCVLILEVKADSHRSTQSAKNTTKTLMSYESDFHWKTRHVVAVQYQYQRDSKVFGGLSWKCEHTTSRFVNSRQKNNVLEWLMIRWLGLEIWRSVCWGRRLVPTD